MAKTRPYLGETMKLVDLVEAMEIMRNPYIEVRWRIIDPIMEGQVHLTQSTGLPLGRTFIPY
jgi:hypothetical protein